MSIATEITRIKGAKEAMKTSIRNKGVAVDDAATLDTYASKVNEIASASGIGNLDLSGTGWETEPTFPVNIARIDTLQQDLDYTRETYKRWIPDATTGNSFCKNDKNLIYAPKIDMSNKIEVKSIFSGCSNMVAAPQFNTSNLRSFNSFFSGCASLVSVPFLDMSGADRMANMFKGCTSLTTIPKYDTSKFLNFQNAFEDCTSLVSVPLLDASSSNNFYLAFKGCTSLQHMSGLMGLRASVSFADSPLTYTSLMNIINNLGQADPSVSGGNPVLTLGATNLAKLSPDEIKIGTDKGWQIVE